MPVRNVFVFVSLCKWNNTKSVLFEHKFYLMLTLRGLRNKWQSEGVPLGCTNSSDIYVEVGIGSRIHTKKNLGKPQMST